MRPRLPAVLFGLSLLCAWPAAHAQDRPTVTWGMSPWPGLVDARDGQPQGGIIVELLQQITTRLPAYEHRYSLINLSRGLEHLQRGELNCLLPTFRTAERDRLGHYVGLFVGMPHQLVVRRSDRAAFLAGRDEVSLRQLLGDTAWRGGLLKDRSYGPMLDPLLRAPAAQAQLLQIQSSDAGHNLLRMLEHGRIDYLLEYAEVLQHVQGRGEAQQLVLLPLHEAGQPALSGIYCTRSAAGAELVRAVDRVARQADVLQAFRDAQRSYLPPATRAHYRAWLERFFAERATQDLTSLGESL